MNQLNTVPSAKKPLSKKRKIIYGSIIAVFVIMMIVSNKGSSSPSSTPPAQEQSALVGDVAYLQSTAPILVAPTEVNFDRAMQLAVAHDTTGISKMVLSGDIFTVPSGTQVRVIGKNFPKTEVRIMDGDSAGLSGWVPAEFVLLTPPAEKIAPVAETVTPAPIAQKSLASTVTEKSPVQSTAPASKSPVASAYCTTVSDCDGFKIRINFREDSSCEKYYSCKYHDYDYEEEYVYYVTIKGGTFDGEVMAKNLNTGKESPFANLSGSYDAASGKMDLYYGHYQYPNIQEGWLSTETKGSVSGGQFVGDDGKILGDVINLPITLSDKIPKKGCSIKGDKSHLSDYEPVYYVPSSASYGKVNSPRDWFCSESDAIAAGYSKALQ